MAECNKFIQDHSLERSRDVIAIKTTCEQMMLVALEQVKKKLSSTQNMFENLTTISPKNILSQISRCSFHFLCYVYLVLLSLEPGPLKLLFHTCQDLLPSNHARL